MSMLISPSYTQSLASKVTFSKEPPKTIRTKESSHPRATRTKRIWALTCEHFGESTYQPPNKLRSSGRLTSMKWAIGRKMFCESQLWVRRHTQIYFTHQPVIREDKETTKIRPVFDSRTPMQFVSCGHQIHQIRVQETSLSGGREWVRFQSFSIKSYNL